MPVKKPPHRIVMRLRWEISRRNWLPARSLDREKIKERYSRENQIMSDRTDADVRLVRIIKQFYEVGKQTEQLLSGGEDRETVLDGLLRVFQDVQHIHDRLTACTPQDVFSHVIIRYLEMLEKLVEEIESDKGVSARTKESLIQLHIRIVMKMKRMLIDHHADDLLHDQGFLEFSAQYMD
ncbi:MAG: hypothetical protein K6G16_00855, partial [Lachnospiraceae bacterium]|nr:hypothetical protein [Lachnospiraceae bacterium]